MIEGHITKQCVRRITVLYCLLDKLGRVWIGWSSGAYTRKLFDACGAVAGCLLHEKLKAQLI